MQLSDLFDLSLINRATVDALDYDHADGTTATLIFGELDARGNRVARALTGRGLERGDRLGFFLPNRVEFIDLFLACVKLGVIVCRSTCSTASARSITASLTRTAEGAGHDARCRKS